MQLHNRISNWLKEYIEEHNLESFVVGISGGIDSALTSTLCAMTGKKTIVVTMPIHQNKDETNRGLDHIEWLKAEYKDVCNYHIDLTDAYEQLVKSSPEKFRSKLSLANTRARIRMSTLYLIASSSRGIVVGTGNKIEDYGVGFFTKYGDGGVDISPIADLMKSEVYELAEKIGINQQILEAKPTDGLLDDGRTDEDQLGVSYDELEWAMNYDGSKSLNKHEKKILKIYNEHRNANFHKMNPIPVFKK